MADKAAPTIKLLRKLSPSTVTDDAFGDKFLLTLGATRPVKPRTLFNLFGVVSRAKLGNTDKGAYVQFLGEFEVEVVDETTGEITHAYASGKAHIPVLEDQLHAALMSAQADDPKATLQIAVKVGIKAPAPGKPSATGYEYDVQSLIPIQSTNRMANLKQLAHAAAAPALAGPASEGTATKAAKK